ncbi:MAG: amidase [Acidimicrobiia bacterium]
MTASEELARLDATAQADLVRSGTASAVELVEAAIERIERVNPTINAVIGGRYDRARAEAREVGRAGPFAGVPLLVKDLGLTMRGEPYHAGARFLKELGYVAPEDSYLAMKFRDAGFITLGRTNTPEWGSTVTTEPLAYGPTRNPWNTDHSCGGSSGGSAAAVAAGLVPIAHGGDGGGSIRIPAGECGLVGLKPSRGRVSHGPAAGETWMGATIEGVITRSVRDAAAVLDEIDGAMPGDPYTAPPPSRPYAEEVGDEPGRLRIGFLDHPPTAEASGHPDCAAAVHDVARLLESLGHVVEPNHPAALLDDGFSRAFTEVVAACTAADADFWERTIGRPLGEDDLEHDNLALAAWGRSRTAADYLTGVDYLYAWSRRVVSWWEPLDGTPPFDLLLTPTIAVPPPPIGYLAGPAAGQHLREVLQYTAQFNITGQPAISLPLVWNEGGLPIGVQLVAAPWREDVLLRIAAQLETARPWAGRTPPVFADG